MIDVLVGYIPLVMVSICVVSLAVYHFKYRRELEKTDSWLSYYSWGYSNFVDVSFGYLFAFQRY